MDSTAATKPKRGKRAAPADSASTASPSPLKVARPEIQPGSPAPVAATLFSSPSLLTLSTQPTDAASSADDEPLMQAIVRAQDTLLSNLPAPAADIKSTIKDVIRGVLNDGNPPVTKKDLRRMLETKFSVNLSGHKEALDLLTAQSQAELDSEMSKPPPPPVKRGRKPKAEATADANAADSPVPSPPTRVPAAPTPLQKPAIPAVPPPQPKPASKRVAKLKDIAQSLPTPAPAPPMLSPAASPAASPAKSPAKPPAKTPAKSPSKTPAKAPKASGGKKAPVEAPPAVTQQQQQPTIATSALPIDVDALMRQILGILGGIPTRPFDKVQAIKNLLEVSAVSLAAAQTLNSA